MGAGRVPSPQRGHRSSPVPGSRGAAGADGRSRGGGLSCGFKRCRAAPGPWPRWFVPSGRCPHDGAVRKGQGPARLRDEDAPGAFILARPHPEGLHRSCREAAGGRCSPRGCTGTGPSSSSWFCHPSALSRSCPPRRPPPRCQTSPSRRTLVPPDITDGAGPLPAGRPHPTAAASPTPRAGKLLFQLGVNGGKTPRRNIAHPGPGCCRGGGCSTGGTGDARVMLGSCSAHCPHPEGTPLDAASHGGSKEDLGGRFLGYLLV